MPGLGQDPWGKDFLHTIIRGSTKLQLLEF
jgi:hypothetical protein